VCESSAAKVEEDDYTGVFKGLRPNRKLVTLEPSTAQHCAMQGVEAEDF
jgi:hypothetical protein